MSSEPAPRPPTRWPLPLVVGLAVAGIFLLACCGVGGAVALVVYTRMPSVEVAKEKIARAKALALSNAVEIYKLNNDAYPPNLEALTMPQPGGGAPLLAADALLDPWGQPFSYNPAGPNNGGLKPDIWANRPDKQIGNWPGSR